MKRSIRSKAKMLKGRFACVLSKNWDSYLTFRLKQKNNRTTKKCFKRCVSLQSPVCINSLYKIQSYIPSKDLSLYTSRKAWMNQNIWAHEMKELNKKLCIEHRKILLLSDNCSSYKELQLENIKFLYFLPGATATLQVQIHKF